MSDWRSAEPTDGVVALRPWCEDDADGAFRDPALGRFFGSALAAATLAGGPELPNWAIVVSESASVVGRIWCRPGSSPPEIGYYLRRDAWGKGYATCALRLATHWLTTDGGFGAVELCTHPENHRSQRVAARAGYAPAGAIEEYAQFKDGTTCALRFVHEARSPE